MTILERLYYVFTFVVCMLFIILFPITLFIWIVSGINIVTRMIDIQIRFEVKNEHTNI